MTQTTAQKTPKTAKTEKLGPTGPACTGAVKAACRVEESVVGLIGNTPMVKLNRLTGKDDATVYAKLEWYNIGGSIKDRMALFIIEAAEKAGKLDRNKIILEATSGNTGIALAMIAAVKGYSIELVMPESVSVERRVMITAFGAKLTLSPGAKGTGGAVEMKRNLLAEFPGKYIDIDQFSDPANIHAHYTTTGPEIIEQTHGKVDAVLVGVGTAGTGVGISQRIKEFDPKIKMMGILPKLGTAIQGLRNPGELNPTQLFRRDAFDEVIEVEGAEMKDVFAVGHRLAKEEGLFVGISSAAITYVALKTAKNMGKGKTIVIVLPDNGAKYLSTPMWAP